MDKAETANQKPDFLGLKLPKRDLLALSLFLTTLPA
jgi:hypothetical protein